MTDLPTKDDQFSFGLWTVGWRGVDVFGPEASRALLDPVLADLQTRRTWVPPSHSTTTTWCPTTRRAQTTLDASRRRWPDRARRRDGDDQPVQPPGVQETRPDRQRPRGRRYALAKVLRNIDLRRAGRRTYVLWGGREGAESGAAKDVAAALDRYREALNILCDYVREQGYDIRFALEPKPNEPRGDILLPTIGHALAFIYTLDDPDRVGSTRRWVTRRWPDSTTHGIAQALWHGKLFHIDLNGQHGPRFDQDLRFGAGNLRGAFWTSTCSEEAQVLGRPTTATSTSTTSRPAPRTSTASGRPRARACATT